MAVANEYVAIDPMIVILENPTGTPPILADIELKCYANRVALTPEDTEADVDSFCNPEGVVPGSTNWTFATPLLVSFTDDVGEGSWNLLHPLRRTRQTFELRPRDDAVGEGNPSAVFEGLIPSIAFLDHDRGETARFELSISVIGEPVFTTTP